MRSVHLLWKWLIYHLDEECYKQVLLRTLHKNVSGYSITARISLNFDVDTVTISQAIKKRRTQLLILVDPVFNLVPRTMTIDHSTHSHTITQVQENMTIPSPANLDTTLSVSVNTSVDVSHDIDLQPIVTIDPLLTKTEMPFNSHLIIEDITDAEGNSDVDDFLIDHDPAKDSDFELALMNNSELNFIIMPHFIITYFLLTISFFFSFILQKLSNRMCLPILKASSTKTHLLKS
ncbi:hypothetical protein FNV43_RR21033 [Rhamnella rubrinervis]|uniref:Uncharacterized protein n=1 Tax=Rhamnella rubrinervis TaxID=2594499 RepID=A0A8K0DVH5_9ROSA|nr:hypothetical protein FNV43_RR21033 [Rhamnella rubrinervis]